MKYLKIALLLLAAVILLAACKKDEPETPDDPTPPVVDEVPVHFETFTFTPDDFPRMDGSPSTIPLAQALAAVMLGESRENVENRAMFTRTTQAFRNLANGLCDILIVGEPSPLVIDEISMQDFRYDMAPIATDALVFVVSASNPVDNLTSAQVKAIFSGEVINWQQVGGSDLAIAAFQRNEEASSQVLMEKLVMDWEKMADAPMQTIFPGSRWYEDFSLTAIKGFDGGESAIGYTMYHYAVNMGMADRYKILSIDGIMPTADTISSGIYTFRAPYYAVISKDLTEDDNARILYNWLLSADGQAFITSEGYVSVQDSLLGDGVGGANPAADSAGTLMRWNITTDSSKLAPYNSPRSLFTSLRNAALPVLEPFDGYGLLLPYSTAVTMNDGSVHTAKYGFVTAQSGTVVTDPIFDAVNRAVYSSQDGNVTPLPAYHLHMNLPEGDPEFGYRTVQAACAADGSWITPFSYTDIVFRESLMFLIYSYDSFDIDVYDYSGKLLYNMMFDLDWSDRITGDAWQFMYGENEGYGFIQLDDSIYALVDIQTGEMQETDFAEALAFSDGLACVVPSGGNGRWGFVDKDLELVIQPEFAYEAWFINGRAIVEKPDGTQHVIDKQGEVLFSADEGHMISHLLPYGYGYAMRLLHEVAFPTFFTDDFAEIEYPQEALPLGPESSVNYLYNGWFSCMTENGLWVFNASESYPLPSSVQDVVSFIDGFVLFADYGSGGEDFRTGVMRLDGTVIIPPYKNQSIVPIFERPAVSVIAPDIQLKWFAVNIDIEGDGLLDFIGEDYVQAVYYLVDPNGQPVPFAANISESAYAKTDLGILSYDEASGFLSVQGTDYFAWLRINGDAFISIPSMAYSFD